MVREVIGLVAGLRSNRPRMVWAGDWVSDELPDNGVAFVSFATRQSKESFWQSVRELARNLPSSEGSETQRLWLAAVGVSELTRPLPVEIV